LNVVYFCLDTKVPKSQDRYGNSPWKQVFLTERTETRCAQTAVLSDRKEDLLPPCGTAISVRVAGYENKERRNEKLRLLRSSFLSALLEKDGPQDGKPPAYVKKSICLSEASLMDFSKVAVFQVFFLD